MKKQYLLPWLTAPMHKQKGMNACSVFACIHALQLEQSAKGRHFIYDPAALYQTIVKERFGIYDPKRSLAIAEVLDWLKRNNYIKTYMNLKSASGTNGTIRRQVENHKPVIITRTVVENGKTVLCHAMCVVGWDAEGLLAIDSLGQSTKLRTIKDIKEVTELYCLFV